MPPPPRQEEAKIVLIELKLHGGGIRQGRAGMRYKHEKAAWETLTALFGQSLPAKGGNGGCWSGCYGLSAAQNIT